MNVSVILPTYNESEWLAETIVKIDKSIVSAKEISKAEIIVIDDGSSDDTKSVVKLIKTTIPVVLISQKNKGRFLARSTGIDKSKYDFILFIDSRVHIGRKSLDYVADIISKDSKKTVWNSHVEVEKKGNFYARFWDSITRIAWRQYFSNPRETSYGIEEFDLFPKGTTCFLAPKKLVIEAINAFSSKSSDTKSANDDTLMIRYMAEKTRINISPQFNCIYHSRSTLKKFLKHAYHRGKVFVDGFLRNDGNRYFWPLVGFLVISTSIPILLVLFWSHIFYILLAGLLIWSLEFIAALLMGVSFIDALSLTILTPLFALFYGSGIWVATLRRIFK